MVSPAGTDAPRVRAAQPIAEASTTMNTERARALGSTCSIYRCLPAARQRLPSRASRLAGASASGFADFDGRARTHHAVVVSSLLGACLLEILEGRMARDVDSGHGCLTPAAAARRSRGSRRW